MAALPSGSFDDRARSAPHRGVTIPSTTMSGARWVCLPPAPDSPARAREFVRQALTEWDLGDLVDDALLLVSELASNAVLHAASSMVISTTWSEQDGVLHVVVHDDQIEGQPRVRHADAEATSGRGLEIVQHVAERWGVVHERDGKAVWFELCR